jgi:hypothetical protein
MSFLSALRPFLVVALVSTISLHAETKQDHVAAVIAALDKAGGTYDKAGDSLKTVNLSNPKLGIKAKRDVDPFDHAFYVHLGNVSDLESLTILNTTATNDDLVEVAKLTNLKSLNIVNQAKMNDEGLAHLAGLKQLERFGFIGTSMMGHVFKDFNGWTHLKSCSFRGSKIDDEGLKLICEKFPQLESLVLAHADFSDAASVHLAELKGLKNFEIGTHKATTECLRNIVTLPIEYLQLGEQLGAASGIAIVKDIKTLRKLTITSAKDYSDADIAQVATMTQLEHVEFGSLDLSDARLPLLKKFAFLKSMRLVRGNNPYPQETRDKVQAVLPNVKIAFD